MSLLDPSAIISDSESDKQFVNLDFSKGIFSFEEKQYIKKQTNYYRVRYPNHIPIIVNVDSRIISLDKKKFIVPKNITLTDFMTIIEKKLKNLDDTDTIIISVNNNGVVREINNKNILMYDCYEKYRNEELDLLILNVSRYTTFKWVKSFFY
jgi:hypothetical protein